GAAQRLTEGHALLHVGIEGADEHEGVVHHHADQGDHAEEAEEAHLHAVDPMPPADADEAERYAEQHREHLPEAAQRDHDHREHDDEREGKHPGGARSHLAALLALPLEAVAQARIAGEHGLEHFLRHHALRIRGALRAAGQVGLHAHFAFAIEVIDRPDAALDAVAHELAERELPTIGGADAHVLQIAQGGPGVLGVAHPDLHLILTALHALRLQAEE